MNIQNIAVFLFQGFPSYPTNKHYQLHYMAEWLLWVRKICSKMVRFYQLKNQQKRMHPEHEQ